MKRFVHRFTSNQFSLDIDIIDENKNLIEELVKILKANRYIHIRSKVKNSNIGPYTKG